MTQAKHQTTTSTVVLYPTSSVGHLSPTVELAKLFLSHDFRVTIILVDPPSSSISSITSSNPSISFHYLTPLTAPSPPLSTHPLIHFFHVVRLNNHLLLDYLTQLSGTTCVSALILDFFCFPALDVAEELRIPSFFFFSSNASVLSASLRLPSLLSQLPTPLKDLGDSPLHFPGLPPVPASHITIDFHDPNGETYEPFISMFRRMAEADGLIISTFEAMERRAVHALEAGRFPPIYCIGPLVSPPKKEDHACLTWLDSQPKGSVVFVCFGSMGTFSEEQLKEIAGGLERSGQRFLWVVRNPKGEDKMKPSEALLPEGFIERNEGRGMVVKSWVPQVAVLRHEAIGGFVSHCGWNSTLEAVSSGVPMIAWPLFGEQWLNKVILVEAAKVAVEMEGYDKEMVRGEEVERKVRWLVESEGGKRLKDRVVAMRENAMATTMEGGSSYLARRELMEAIKNGGVL